MTPHNLSIPEYRFYDLKPEIADFRNEIVRGLSADKPTISPKYFYDETGSQLFSEICKTDEYYPTRTETAIIHNNIDDIADTLGRGSLLIEPGSGDSSKVRLLLDMLKPIAYLPMDISSQYLQQEAKKLAAEFPWLGVHAVCIDFTRQLEIPYDQSHQHNHEHKIAFFPGSTIGNFKPQQALGFLRDVAIMLGKDGGLLIGVDLEKDSEILNAAYNDKAGITARFNLNLLHRINRELNADFNVDRFTHHAFFNQEMHRIEMHLLSDVDQVVSIDEHQFEFKKNDSILTEFSHKYTLESFQSLAKKAGLTPVKAWLDDKKLFSLQYFQVATS